MKDLLIKQLQVSLKTMMLLVEHPVLGEGFSDQDFERLSMQMGFTAELIDALGGDHTA